MRQKLLLLLLAILAATLPASAYDFMVDGLCYNINDDGMSVSVTYQNSSSPRYSISGPVTIPSSVIYRGTTYSVTSIESSSFEGTNGLTSVIVGNSVTYIGEGAFRSCNNLSSVVIGNSVKTIDNLAFYQCTSISTLIIGISVEELGNRAFGGCSGLKTVTIPNSMLKIGPYAFEFCKGLTKLTIGGSVTEIDTKAFSECGSLKYILSYIENPKSVSYGSDIFYRKNSSCTLYVPSTAISQYSTTYPWSSFSGTELYDFINNGLCYRINSDDTTSCVTFSDVDGDVVIPEVVSNKGHSYSVKSIENLAFYNCSNLTSVSIPSTATSIAAFAFQGCTSLINIIWDVESCADYTESGQPFSGLNNITTFVFGDNVKVIPAYLCCDLTGLTSTSIGRGVKTIKNKTFKGCVGLQKVDVDDIAAWCNINFQDVYANPLCYTHNLYINGNKVIELNIPDTVSSIGSLAFYNCSNLTRVTIPTTVTNIGGSAFQGCSGLTSVTVPSSVTSIGDAVFKNCSGLTKAVLPNSVKAVPNNMFYGCNALTNITLGNAVESFGDYAFSYCNSLKSFTIPSTVKTIGNGAFYNCTGLTSLTIPAGVTSIGESAFGGCSGITTLNYRAKALANPGNLNGMTEVATVNFDSNATVVPAGLLSNYPKLALVNVGKDVANIAEGAFDNCDALKTMNYDAANCASGELAIASLDTLTLGTNVKSIAANMFYNCKNMKKIVCKATTPPELGNGMVFPNGRYIGVPSNVGAKYKEKWAKIANGTYTRVLPLPIYDLNLESGLLVSGKPFVTTRAYSESKAECSETGYIIEDNLNSGNKIKIQPTYTFSNDQYVYFRNLQLNEYVLPGHRYWIYPYIVVNGVEYDGFYYAEMEIPALQSAYQSNVGPSSIILTDDTAIPENINFMSATFTLDNKTYESYGNDIIVTGLKPNKWYYGNYSVAVNEGNVNSTSIEFRTPALTLNTQPVKMLTNTAARLEAYTNLSEEETSCGFLWKRYDAPESMLGNPVYCPVYEGTMTGTLKNLPEGVYYQYRAFYRDSEGKLYYGDDSWVAFYTGDATVEFEPVAHTYDNARVSGANAIIQGVALRGSKDITEQGFEYWVDGAAQSEAHMAPSTVNKVTATGERMTSTLTSLKGGSNYSFRAYVKTADGTTYGEVRTFRTPVTAMPGDVNGDQVISGADVTALYNVLLDGSSAGGDADVNGDGVVSGADVTALYNLLLGQ